MSKGLTNKNARPLINRMPESASRGGGGGGGGGGGSAPGGRGVCVCSRGECLLLGGVCSGGVSVCSGGRCLLQGGVCSGGGVSVPGGVYVLSQQTLPPPVNRMTNRCKNIILATTSLRPVITMRVYSDKTCTCMRSVPSGLTCPHIAAMCTAVRPRTSRIDASAPL